MKTPFDISPFIKGTLQGRQTPAALATNHFLVDERSQLDLMAYATQISCALDFHTLNGSVKGTWESFLLSDVTMLSARIATTNRVNNYNQFIALYEAAKDQDQQKEDYLPSLFALGFEVAIQIDGWYKLSKQNFSVSSIATYLTDLIVSVGSKIVNEFFRLYRSLQNSTPFAEPSNLQMLYQLDPAWKFNPPLEISSQQSELLKRVQTSGQQLFSLQSDIIHWAKEVFEKSLLRKNIPPHIGLLLTYLDLFQEQQKAINTITQRHLDFYYKSVLKAEKKSASPDQTLISVELAKGIDKLLLPKGTALSGGVDAKGAPIVFVVKEDTAVTSAKIATYLTLNLPSEDVNIGTTDMSLATVTNFSELGNAAWPLFGGGLSTGNWSTQSTTLGWAFSCSDLLLAQGTRSVTIEFSFQSLDQDGLVGIDLSSFFDIKLTAKEGWHTVSIDKVHYEKNQLILSFLLTPSDPSIISYDGKIHGAGYNSSWPVCAITLAADGKRKYAMLTKLRVSDLSITTDVKGVCDFLIENESGKLPTTAPFIPFNEPLPGSNLYIGGQEFFVKKLTQFDLTIVWDKLPASFQEYYSAYNSYYQNNDEKKRKAVSYTTPSTGQEEILRNQSFKTKIYELDGDRWKAVSKEGVNRAEYCLFTDDVTPQMSTSINESPFVKNKQKVISLKGPFRFNPLLPAYTGLNNNLREGFFCLSLSSPSQGFGCVEYPIIVSSVTLDNSAALMHNARTFPFRLSGKWPIKPLPAIPYVPKMKGMEVGYHSSQTYRLDQTSASMKWYHLHPLGVETIDVSEELPELLPNYSSQAYAYWGVDTLLPNTNLSIILVIESEAKSISQATSNDFTFEYMSTHGWRKLMLVFDGTEGFQRSGEIKFSVPMDLAKGGVYMPTSLYWLRCGQKTYSKINSSFLSTQAVSLVREVSEQYDYQPLKADSITKLIGSVPGIKSVKQPLPSFGGVQLPTDAEYYSAVSGRLRHKRRVITLSDVETILLDEFPQLYKVTALPAAYGNVAQSGLVRVMIIPYTDSLASDRYQPIASQELMLSVFDFLKEIGIPSVCYEISNPDFVELKITCQVQFNQPNKEQVLAEQLNNELNNFLSPWMKGNTQTYSATENLSGSMLYSFIQSRGYVREIEEFSYFLFDSNHEESGDGIAVSPQTLIIPDKHHTIYSGSKQETLEEEEDLRIGETFYINP
ncbi:MAG: hypothetical protein ACK5PC_20625 [Cyclobacteriaceae bacterium]|nr:hypothetical protein [Flammeovirgaceae bacterium]